MDIFSNEPVIKTEKPMPHEIVLRLFVKQLEAGYKDGWLYYQCRDKGLLQPYQEYRTKGIFNLLKGEEQRDLSPKLTIELVPKTCWFSNVRSNITKAEWNKLKKMTARNAVYQCEICGGKGPKWPVECHEIWNYNDEALIQRLTGLIALCPSCHKVKHMGFAEISGKDIETKCHLAIVNSWSYKTACGYVEQQFDVWRERSKYSWLLDISWLEKFDIQIDTQDRLAVAYQKCSEEERDYYLVNRKRAIDLFDEGSRHENNKDYNRAEDSYLSASEYGNIDATFNLAVFHLKNKITHANYEQGVFFLRKAAKLGDQDAKKILALSKEEFNKLIIGAQEKKETKEVDDQIPAQTNEQKIESHVKIKGSNQEKNNTLVHLIKRVYQWLIGLNCGP